MVRVEATSLEGVLLLEPRVFADARGFFFESYNQREFAAAGIPTVFVQDNHSKSCRRTLRGLHYQVPPHAQAKLVHVVAGEIFDAVVDLRPASPTFGRGEGFTLSAENHRMLYVPTGFAHGFCVTSETAEVLYKCSDFYAPEHERALIWNDPEVGVAWPVPDPLLSDRDRRGRSFAELRREL
jgi:dTDP-4-dehydrorhamnose 3,5-epimerase